MRLEDKRDEALGALLRRAAESAAGAPGASREVFGQSGAGSGKVLRPVPRKIRAWIAGGAVLAAALAAAFMAPALARLRADRELLSSAAEHLSRSLILESSSFLAELPAASELESAAADWAGSLFRTDAGL